MANSQLRLLTSNHRCSFGRWKKESLNYLDGDGAHAHAVIVAALVRSEREASEATPAGVELRSDTGSSGT